MFCLITTFTRPDIPLDLIPFIVSMTPYLVYFDMNSYKVNKVNIYVKSLLESLAGVVWTYRVPLFYVVFSSFRVSKSSSKRRNLYNGKSFHKEG